MKRIIKLISLICCIMSCFILSTLNVSAYTADLKDTTKQKLNGTIVMFIGNPNAYVNGMSTVIDPEYKDIYPMKQRSEIYVPLKFIAESLGGQVCWNEITSTGDIVVGNDFISVSKGSNIILVNGYEEKISSQVKCIRNKLYIPLRPLMKILDKNLYYDNNGIIIISNKNQTFDSEKDKEMLDEIMQKSHIFIESMNVADDKIYYCGNNDKIYSIKTDGTSKLPIANSGVLAKIVKVVGDEIYYISPGETAREYKNGLLAYDLYMAKADGKSNVKLGDNICTNDINTQIFLKDGYVYFVDEDNFIYKVKKDGTSLERIVGESASFINFSGGYIYYVTDGIINRVKNDGTEKTRISKYKTCDFLKIMGDSIYFGYGNSSKLYKMQLDGTRAKKIVDDELTYIFLTYNYIYYQTISGELCRADLNGLNSKMLIEEPITDYLSIEGNYIYYISEDQLCRMKIDGTGKVVLIEDTSGMDNFNIRGIWIYYTYDNLIFKIKINGTDQKRII